MKLNRNIKIFINYFLGPLLFVWLSWSIYREVKKQPNLESAWLHIRESFNGPLVWNLVAVVVLMVVNWSIEAVKWRLSVKPVQQVSFLKALKAVLSGVSFSVSTPNRVGEYLGRVLYMDEGNRLRTISLTIVGSISQLIVTILMGGIGLVVLRTDIESGNVISGIWMKVVIYGTLAAFMFLTLFYFRLSWLIRLVDRLPGNSRFAYLVKALEEIRATLLLRLLSLSLLRFVVFIVQYYLLFSLFGVELSWWQAFWSVSVSFLVMAVIPTFAIAELGLRGKVGLILIGLFSTNSTGIIFATAGIWFINLVIPAIAGSLLILSLKKIYIEKDE
ncbi:MAG: lysylphosphatidylglycerol synthase domain-containing protein [Chitinophagaceae bacterium]